MKQYVHLRLNLDAFGECHCRVRRASPEELQQQLNANRAIAESNTASALRAGAIGSMFAVNSSGNPIPLAPSLQRTLPYGIILEALLGGVDSAGNEAAIWRRVPVTNNYADAILCAIVKETMSYATVGVNLAATIAESFVS